MGKKKDVDKKVKNWRNKKKGDKEEKLDNMDDGEEEPLVIVPAVETSPEPTPQPTPEPKQAKKEKKKEKRKIPIEEVEEIAAVEEVVEATIVPEEVAVVEKVEVTAASPVAAIEEEIEQVQEPVKVV